MVQGAFSVAQCQTLISRFATFSSPYPPSLPHTALNNLEHLGVVLAKKSSTAKAKEALSWSSKTAQASAPKHRALESSEWSLSRFQPLVHMLLEELTAGSLSSAPPRPALVQVVLVSRRLVSPLSPPPSLVRGYASSSRY
jgi:hypothetical protein